MNNSDESADFYPSIRVRCQDIILTWVICQETNLVAAFFASDTFDISALLDLVELLSEEMSQLKTSLLAAGVHVLVIFGALVHQLAVLEFSQPVRVMALIVIPHRVLVFFFAVSVARELTFAGKHIHCIYT